MRCKLLFGLLFIVFSATVHAQKLSGKVRNIQNEPLVGATIKIVGTSNGTSSSQDGSYTLNLAQGRKYEIEVSAVSYQPKIISDVEVKEGTANVLDIVLEAKSTAMEGVVVTARRTTARMETAASVIQFQKNTNTVASVVSAETIRRSPDRNTGEVLKRTPGASLLDGKFLVVRGLADRYNQAMLNGILLSSTEPDRKAFSFDIIPSSMIDNIIINKAFVPEMPGEWAGGLIQVNTKDIPTQNFFNVQIGTGLNTQTIGKDFYRQKAGGLDWLGIDNGYRNVPAPYTSKNQFRLMTPEQKTVVGKAMNNDWLASIGNASPNVSFQANGGFSGTLFGKKIGGALGVNYNRTNRTIQLLNQDNVLDGEQTGFSIPNNSWNDNRYNQETTLGALASLTMQLNNQNKVSLKSIANVNTNSYTIVRNGSDNDLGDGYGQENTFKQNTFFTTQLIGEHTIVTPLKLKWYGSFSILDGYSPDQRRYMYFRPVGATTPYELQIGEGYDIRSSNRLYQSLNDYIYTAGGDLSYNFNMFGKKQTVKGGYMLQVKDRLFNATMFTVSLPGGNAALRQLTPDQVFAPENYGNAPGKLLFDFLDNKDMRYLANTILNAGYVQFDNQFTDKLRVVWGVRAENYDQLIGSVKKWSEKHNHSEQLDFLPGLNATYKLNNQTNLRLSGSQTVIRPELRELAELALYDFELNATVSGNPALLRTKITNLDFRYELYQRPGEAITAGVFYKHFVDPIEQQLEAGGQLFTFRNTEKAQAYGVELELRKKLDLLTDGLKNFTFQANAAYIYSQVKDASRNIDRPLVGQSPYLLNLSLMYDLEDKGFNTTLLFNQIGRRIYMLGDVRSGGSRPDVWEAPRPVLDWQISKKIIQKKGELRLNVSDILNSKLRFYQNAEGNATTYQSGTDALRFTRRYGTTFNLSFNYSL